MHPPPPGDIVFCCFCIHVWAAIMFGNVVVFGNIFLFTPVFKIRFVQDTKGPRTIFIGDTGGGGGVS